MLIYNKDQHLADWVMSKLRIVGKPYGKTVFRKKFPLVIEMRGGEREMKFEHKMTSDSEILLILCHSEQTCQQGQIFLTCDRAATSPTKV